MFCILSNGNDEENIVFLFNYGIDHILLEEYNSEKNVAIKHYCNKKEIDTIKMFVEKDKIETELEKIKFYEIPDTLLIQSTSVENEYGEITIELCTKSSYTFYNLCVKRNGKEKCVYCNTKNYCEKGSDTEADMLFELMEMIRNVYVNSEEWKSLDSNGCFLD
jgi:hypothetical protein